MFFMRLKEIMLSGGHYLILYKEFYGTKKKIFEVSFNWIENTAISFSLDMLIFICVENINFLDESTEFFIYYTYAGQWKKKK